MPPWGEHSTEKAFWWGHTKKGYLYYLRYLYYHVVCNTFSRTEWLHSIQHSGSIFAGTDNWLATFSNSLQYLLIQLTWQLGNWPRTRLATLWSLSSGTQEEIFHITAFETRDAKAWTWSLLDADQVPYHWAIYSLPNSSPSTHLVHATDAPCDHQYSTIRICMFSSFGKVLPQRRYSVKMFWAVALVLSNSTTWPFSEWLSFFLCQKKRE